MRGKEMCLLKINKNKLIFLLPFLFVTLFLPNQSSGNQTILSSQISKYFFKINNFTSKFIQSDSDGIQEGNIYISNKIKRIKIHYTDPSNIIFILKNNKAMYFNIDLEEVEYFNTKKIFSKSNIIIWIYKSHNPIAFIFPNLYLFYYMWVLLKKN